MPSLGLDAVLASVAEFRPPLTGPRRGRVVAGGPILFSILGRPFLRAVALALPPPFNERLLNSLAARVPHP